jgi:hypothetical protein
VITTLVKVALQSSSSRGARPQSTRAAPHAVILVAGAASGTKILEWLVQTAPPRIGSRRRDGHPHGYCRPEATRAGGLADCPLDLNQGCHAASDEKNSQFNSRAQSRRAARPTCV